MSSGASSARPMRLYLAQPRGFCAAVVRAIEIVERALVVESFNDRHPEVEGTIGQVPGPVLLVQSVEDVKALRLRLPGDRPVAYIKFADIQGPDIRDICYATQNRQTAVRELSKLVGVILVVGATNSSKSNRLREIGSEAGAAGYFIADGSEVNPHWLKGVKAAASRLAPRRRC
jgi:4-hydroxy-3-methylbut-2-enyl diphosphate reductase IspH